MNIKLDGYVQKKYQALRESVQNQPLDKKASLTLIEAAKKEDKANSSFFCCSGPDVPYGTIELLKVYKQHRDEFSMEAQNKLTQFKERAFKKLMLCGLMLPNPRSRTS